MDKKKRMLEIMESLNKTEEVYKVDSKLINEEEINKDYERLRKNLSNDTNRDFKDFKNENYYMSGSYNTGGRGQTVNNILDDKMGIASNAKTPKPEKQSLQPQEALLVSIARTVKSGAPVNNIDFYEEINWNLMNLGFPAKSPVDIKNALVELLGPA